MSILKTKKAYIPDSRMFYTIALLSLVTIILLIIVFYPEAVGGFQDMMDAVQRTAIVLALCTIMIVSAYLIFDDRRKSFGR